eukprot:EST49362.1 Hypothetical protein SS50377_10287 [Spironucleus salmonicida]
MNTSSVENADNISITQIQYQQASIEDINFNQTFSDERKQDDLVEFQIINNLAIYTYINKTYSTPLTIWDLFDPKYVHKTIIGELMQNLKDLSLLTRYQTRFIHNEKSVSYQSVLYSQKQIEMQISNIIDQQYIIKLIESFIISNYNLVIIGSPPIANLLARSLQLLLPPRLRQNVQFCQTVPCNLFICDSQVVDFKQFIEFPNQSTEIYYQSDKVVVNTEKNLFYTKEQCECGNYKHGQLISQCCSIQSLSVDIDFYNNIDYLINSTQQLLLTIIGCIKEKSIINLGNQKIFKQVAEKVQLYSSYGNTIALKHILEAFTCQLQYTTSQSILPQSMICQYQYLFGYITLQRKKALYYTISLEELLKNLDDTQQNNFVQKQYQLIVKRCIQLYPQQIQEFIQFKYLLEYYFPGIVQYLEDRQQIPLSISQM